MPNQNPNNQREQKHNELKKNQLVNAQRTQKRPKEHKKKTIELTDKEKEQK